MRKVELLPTRDCEAGYGTVFCAPTKFDWELYFKGASFKDLNRK